MEIESQPQKFKTKSVQYNPSCKRGQEIAHFFWKSNVHYRVNISPPLPLTWIKEFMKFRDPMRLLVTSDIMMRDYYSRPNPLS